MTDVHSSRSDVPAVTSPSAPNACASCSRLDRRGFIGTASLLSVGALLAACGDGVFDGPEALLNAIGTPIRVDLQRYPTLLQVGGRAVISAEGRAPMVVETTGAGQYRAFSLVCPHRGTIVNPTSDGFLCPNHGARFSRDGVWQGGQTTVDLSPVAVVVDTDGSLLVGGLVAPPRPPAISVSVPTVSFSATVGGPVPASQTVLITNGGDGTLSGIGLSLRYGNNQPSGWLAASLSSIGAPSTLTLTVARGSLPAGAYSATVELSVAGASNTPQAIAVNLVVIDTATPPSIQLSTPTLSVSGRVNAIIPTQTVQVINSGAGTIGALSMAITYGAGASGWLSTSSLNGTSTPSSITVRPVIGGLAAGVYTATITVSGAGVSPRTVVVTLTVEFAGLVVTIAAWPTLANVGGVAGSVGSIDFSPVAVVRTGPNSFAAFSLICPHAGFYVQVINGQSFRCPNHGATWNASGTLLPNSPTQTSSLQRMTVSYTPGDPVLYVS